MNKHTNIKKQDEEKEKKNRKWIFILLIFLLLCFFGYCAYELSYSVGKRYKPVSPDPTPERFVIEVNDKNGKWRNYGPDKTNRISLFSIDTESKIVAPYDRGTYEFEVKNALKGEITYNLYLEEVNKDQINIKYKLKKNGNYIISKWSYFDKIVANANKLSASSKDEYVLEWGWISENDDLDTKAGKKKQKNPYELKINIIAQDSLEG